MHYNFGEYQVSVVKRTQWATDTTEKYRGFIWFRDKLIDHTVEKQSHSEILDWATEEINRHKESLKRLEHAATS